jgi:AcrR family transcriptional regulator
MRNATRVERVAGAAILEPMSETERRRPGARPDPEADRLILEAAQQLLVDEGYARMSMDGIARRAGVARTTVYRRYADKAELVTAAIEHSRTQTELPDLEDAQAELEAHLEFVRRMFDASLAGTMLVEERHNPELVRRFRERIVRPRFGYVRDVLIRGMQRGEVRKDLDVDATLELFFGAYLAHCMKTGRPGRDWPKRVVAALWPALASDISWKDSGHRNEL